MYRFTGIPASDGVVVGPAVQIDHGTTGLHRIVRDPYRERALYEAAIVLAKDELRRLQQHARGEDADILTFQIALLEDESFTNEIGDYIAAGAGSAAAVERAEQIFVSRLSNVDNDYIRERSVDVCDACRRVVAILDGRPRRRVRLTRPSVLVSDQFFPSDLFSLDRSLVLGLASENDSATSHAAILARSMGMPAVARLGDGVSSLAAGHRVIVDGESGVLIIEPTAVHLAEADRKIAVIRRRHEIPDPVAALPCLTRDGEPFRLFSTANLATPTSMSAVFDAGATGIGLVRTESTVLEEMDEDRQYYLYTALMASAEGVPVAFRTCDSGADDGAAWAKEISNRMNGLRLFRPQILALLRAGTEGDLRVLLPMIPDADAWNTCMAEVEDCKAELRSRGVPFREDLPFGCVIDMPSAALTIGDILDNGAQLLGIDVDDLTRYTCGISRTDEGYRADTPAVLRLVKSVVQQADERDVPVYLNGITQAELPAIPALLRTGVRRFCTENALLAALKATLIAVNAREPDNEN
ncbi:MAG: putative PEP-binding protein [Gemmiger sp.]